MKKNKDQNVCIRIDRDGTQIERCKGRIQEVNTPLTEMTQILSLAGNEVRLKVLLLLQAEEKLCVCDLSEILDMKIPAVSQHLRKMKDARMLYPEREGTVIFYQISENAKPVLEAVFEFMPDKIEV